MFCLIQIQWDGDVFPCWFRCFNSMLGNGKCDSSCNKQRCGWDHGDCGNITQYHIKQNYPVIFDGGKFRGSVFNTIAMFNKRSIHSDGIIHFKYPPHRPLLVNKQLAADIYKR